MSYPTYSFTPKTDHVDTINAADINELQDAIEEIATRPVAEELTDLDTTVTGAQLDALKSKVDGIASGATANASDADLRDRATHTGSQAISTVTGLQTAIDGKAGVSHTHGAADITSGTLDVARIPTGIPATSIGGGTIDNTEYSYLNGLTGPIQVQLDNKPFLIQLSSTTAVGTASKTASGAPPVTGYLYAVTYANGNTAANATLNIGGSGAKNIRVNGTNATAAGGAVAAGGVVLYYYDGTYFQQLGSALQTDTNTTYTEISEAEITAGTSGTTRLISGRRSEFMVQKAIAGALPSQTGNSGKFLTTNGTASSWDTPTASVNWGSIGGSIGSQTDLSGALNNKSDYWHVHFANDILPDQTGNSGKFLATDGTDVFWDDAPSGGGGGGGSNTFRIHLPAMSGAGVTPAWYIMTAPSNGEVSAVFYPADTWSGSGNQAISMGEGTDGADFENLIVGASNPVSFMVGEPFASPLSVPSGEPVYISCFDDSGSPNFPGGTVVITFTPD